MTESNDSRFSETSSRNMEQLIWKLLWGLFRELQLLWQIIFEGHRVIGHIALSKKRNNHSCTYFMTFRQCGLSFCGRVEGKASGDILKQSWSYRRWLLFVLESVQQSMVSRRGREIGKYLIGYQPFSSLNKHGTNLMVWYVGLHTWWDIILILKKHHDISFVKWLTFINIVDLF